jgi:Mn2+/Fe2+ NRAMP family transporter
MSGFLNLRVEKWVRTVVTRGVAIFPTVIVALIFNSAENQLDNLSEWLNVLQSIQLPFALLPLLCLVSNHRIMGVFVIDKVTKVHCDLILLKILYNRVFSQIRMFLKLLANTTWRIFSVIHGPSDHAEASP